MSNLFLEPDEIVAFTGRKFKGLQIAALRKMGVTFYVNATGHPVVTRYAVEGRKDESELSPPAWVPRVLRDR